MLSFRYARVSYILRHGLALAAACLAACSPAKRFSGLEAQVFVQVRKREKVSRRSRRPDLVYAGPGHHAEARDSRGVGVLEGDDQRGVEFEHVARDRARKQVRDVVKLPEIVLQLLENTGAQQRAADQRRYDVSG